MNQIKNVRVGIKLINGESIYGTLNIGTFERTSDFFNNKFRNGGNIHLVSADDGNSIGNKKMNRGFNARHVLSWIPVNENI